MVVGVDDAGGLVLVEADAIEVDEKVADEGEAVTISRFIVVPDSSFSSAGMSGREVIWGIRGNKRAGFMIVSSW